MRAPAIPGIPSDQEDLPWFISTDDHMVEPPHLYDGRLPRHLQDRAPKLVHGRVASMGRVGTFDEALVVSEDGQPGDYWTFEGKTLFIQRNGASAGMDPSTVGRGTVTYDEMRPGCYDAKARLEDMDVNHVEASLCFPTVSRLCGQLFYEVEDKELGMACMRAYNDFMVEEWCGDSGGRLIPLCVIPLWDPTAAAAEIRRNAERGVRAVSFSEIPPFLGLPSLHDPDRYWEPFIEACAETDTAICMHIGSSSRLFSGSTDAPPAVGYAMTFNNAMASLADWIFSGTLRRHPSLKLAYSEAQIGWLPYALERMDNVWEHYTVAGGISGVLDEPPSAYFHRSVYGCFFEDRHGLESLDKIGRKNVTFETDYPHSDGTWPHTKDMAVDMFKGLDDEVVYDITRGNAIRMLSLDLDSERGAASGQNARA
jgi:predicted TIM-barrel fold metal-dependent hydrolase